MKEHRIAAVHIIGEAFESVDCTSCISFGRDTDYRGIYGCIIELSDGKWNIIKQTVL